MLLDRDIGVGLNHFYRCQSTVSGALSQIVVNGDCQAVLLGDRRKLESDPQASVVISVCDIPHYFTQTSVYVETLDVDRHQCRL
jgi:hypothetical protein